MNQREQAIVEALKKLDVNKDSDWTAEGTPAIKAVSELSGLPDTVTRDEVSKLAPELTRDAARELLDNQEDAADEPELSEAEQIEADLKELQAKIDKAEAQRVSAEQDLAKLYKKQTALISRKDQPGVAISPSQRLKEHVDRTAKNMADGAATRDKIAKKIAGVLGSADDATVSKLINS